EPELQLVRQAVDLVDHAIDLVRQTCATQRDVMEEIEQALCPLHDCSLPAYGYAQCQVPVQQRGMGGRHRRAFQNTYAIGKETQAALCSNAGVELPQAAGCSVARIGKVLQASGTLAFIELEEIRLVHQHFTAHFQNQR